MTHNSILGYLKQAFHIHANHTANTCDVLQTLRGVYIQKSICLSEDINKTKWRKKKYREQFNNFHALKIDEMTNPKGFTSGNII